MNQSVAIGRQTYGGTLARAGGCELQAAQERGGALAAVLYASPPYAVTLPPLGVARLSINLSPARVSGGLQGDPPRAFLARRHSLFLTPAGAAAAWSKASSSRHINIYFDPGAFARADDGAWGPLLGDGAPLFNAGLSGAGPMIDMLAAELAEDQSFGAEAVDSLARLVLLRLARRQVQAAQRANPLTPLLQARLAEYIRERLDQRLLVADLAAVTGLPPNRFAQAFASATGRSPHQYVLQLRLDRAVHLLQRSADSLAQIAAACGFASQQHMTRVMRQRLGVTPARQRQCLRVAQATGVEPALAGCAALGSPGGHAGDAGHTREDRQPQPQQPPVRMAAAGRPAGTAAGTGV